MKLLFHIQVNYCYIVPVLNMIVSKFIDDLNKGMYLNKQSNNIHQYENKRETGGDTLS